MIVQIIKKYCFILVIFYTFSVGAFANNIVYPGKATSAIVEKGQTFEILYYNLNLQDIDSIKLVSKYFDIILEVQEVKVGHYIYDVATRQYVNNRIRVSIPSENAYEDLYDLIVYTDNSSTISKKSVKVVNQFNDAHKIIHISDLHVSRNWNGDSVNGYAIELELLDKFIEVANIINPDLIIITGDNIMEYTRFNPDSIGWGGVKIYDKHSRPSLEEKYRNLFYGAAGLNGLFSLDSPFFLTTGNHDYYGIAENDYQNKMVQWNRMCGLRVYGFSYGSTRVLVTDDSLFDPEENQLTSSNGTSGIQGKILEEFLEKDGIGKLRILAQHHHNVVDTQFLDRNNVQLLLNGHNHSPSVITFGEVPTTAIRSGVVCRSGEVRDWEENLGMFRLISVRDGSYEFTEPLRFCKDPTQNYNLLELNLTTQFLIENNGKADSNKVDITNNFGVDLQRCRVRFVMQPGNYQIDNGIIFQIAHLPDKTIVDIDFDIRKHTTSSINIYKTN